MATQSSSAGDATKDQRDMLTTFPPEILVKIMAHLPLKYYLDLVHTSKALRNFIKINASRICNEAIRTRFEFEAKILNSELEAGWLVPRSALLREMEGKYLMGLGEAYFQEFEQLREFHRGRKGAHWSLLSPIQNTYSGDFAITLSSPGPQYLYLLEMGLLIIGVGEFTQVADLGLHTFEQGEVVLGGQTYFYEFCQSAWDSGYRTFEGENHFEIFMEPMNEVRVFVKHRNKDGELVPVKPAGPSCDRFPREIIWFYGVERLKVTEPEEVQDWKNLPKLLWE